MPFQISLQSINHKKRWTTLVDSVDKKNEIFSGKSPCLCNFQCNKLKTKVRPVFGIRAQSSVWIRHLEDIQWMVKQLCQALQREDYLLKFLLP